MGEILADTAAVPKHFRKRRIDGRCAGIELKLAMDPGREVDDGFEHTAAWREAFGGIVAHFTKASEPGATQT